MIENINNSSVLIDQDPALQDLTKRLTAAELHAKMAETNAVAAERARAVLHAELRAVQLERDKLRMEVAGLKARLEQTTANVDATAGPDAPQVPTEASQANLFFSCRLVQPLGKAANFDLFYHDGHGLVAHPISFETVIIELNFSPDKTISMIKMEASLPDARAQAVEYALIVAGEPITSAMPVNPDFQWNLLSPEENAEVTLNLPTEAGRVTALLYLRMLDPNNGHDYCGTRWRPLLAA